ncbi:MAG: transcription-repair coupling factor, partial [Leptolyngbyaceae cyanobacterium]
MALSSVVRLLGRSPLTQELLTKLDQQQYLELNGAPRIPKGLVSSTLAQARNQHILVITSTLEEAGRWTAQLEMMGWATVHFYPTSESSPYDPFDSESEMIWGQLQVLAELLKIRQVDESGSEGVKIKPTAIVATERSLQPPLPPVERFRPYCLTLTKGMEIDLKEVSHQLTKLGYERVQLVETEGQWSRRGDMIDVYPVSSELPVRLELVGDELERIREFDPGSQRSLDAIDQLVLTTTDYKPIIMEGLGVEVGVELKDGQTLPTIVIEYLSKEGIEQLTTGTVIEGLRRFLGVAFDHPASLLDYLPDNMFIAVDEVEQCRAHSDRWYEHVNDLWNSPTPVRLSDQVEAQLPNSPTPLPQLHRPFTEALEEIECFDRVYLSEINEEGKGLNLASRPVPTLPHQFGKLAEILREERDRKFSTWLLSAQPSRSVALLQEHDCPAQFIP